MIFTLCRQPPDLVMQAANGDLLDAPFSTRRTHPFSCKWLIAALDPMHIG
jgi:hypothetical protein